MSQDPEMPPVEVIQSQVSEGADIDTVIRRAQDERIQAENDRRMKEVFGINPNRPITDPQLQRLNEFKEAMDTRDERAADRAAAEARGEEYFIESDKPVDSAQVETIQQSDDLEEVANMLRESSDPQHQAEAWKLFDTFVEYHNLSREEERARRNYLLSLIHESKPSETPVVEQPAPMMSSSDSEQPQMEQQQSSAPIEIQVDKIFDEIPVEPTESKPESGDQESEKPVEEAEVAEESANDKSKPYDWEAEGAFESLKEQASEIGEGDVEEESAVEETEKASIFERMRAGSEKTFERVKHYFSGGTEEENIKHRTVAVALGVGVLLAAGIAVSAISGHNAAEIANHGSAALHSFGPGYGVHEIVSGSSEALKPLGTIHEHLSGAGDTIWAHAHSLLQEWGVKASNHNILRLTSDILKDNNLSWEAARHMAKGAHFVVNPPAWVR